MSEFVRMEREGAIAILVLDVPGEPVNTLSPKFSDAFAQAIAQVESDSSIAAAIVISGKKDNFIAGADIKVLETVRSADDGVALSKQGQAALQRLATLSKPLVAAIHGACLGGGLEVALACHYRVATDDKKTKLGLPEVQLGLLPGAGGTQRLARLLPAAIAKQMIYFGEPLAAERALSLGLINAVVTSGEVLQEAHAWAERLAGLPPLALRSAKLLVQGATFNGLVNGIEAERQAVSYLFQTQDAREGIQAFLDKRAPSFQGS